MTSGFLVLLPPSETKRDGGNSALSQQPTGLAAEEREPREAELAWPALNSIRTELIDDLVTLAHSPEAMARALKLGPKLVAIEQARNLTLRTSERMPAVLRYTGVLFDALDAESLPDDAFEWLATHVAIHSALFGLVGAGEEIPAYRCSAGSALPGPSLRSRWRAAIGEALVEHDGTVLDLRSTSYQQLGPAPRGAVQVDIVADDGTGATRALNHWNKRAKGEVVRAMAGSPEVRRALGPDARGDDIVDALRTIGFDAQMSGPDVIRLTVEDPRLAGVRS